MNVTTSMNREALLKVLHEIPLPMALFEESVGEALVLRKKNRAFDAFFGLNPGPMREENLVDFLGDVGILNIPVVETALRSPSNTTFAADVFMDPDNVLSVSCRTVHLDMEEGQSTRLLLIEDRREKDQLKRKLNKIHHQYEAFFEQSPDIYYLVDTEGRFKDMNHKGAEYFKRTKEEILKLTYLEVIFEEDRDMVQGKFLGILNKEVAQFEMRSINKLGEIGYLDITAIPVIIDGEVMEVFGIAKDIRHRKEMEVQLKESEERYRSLFEDNIDAVLTFDLAGNFQYLNKATEELMGYKKEELIGTPFLPHILEDRQEYTLGEFMKVLKGKAIRYETAMYNRKREVVELHITVVPIILGGELQGIHCIGKDITERKNMERILQEMVYEDFLTHLPNQRALQKHFEMLLTKKEKFALLLLDLDRFKMVNDSWGHEMGDLLLKAVSHRLAHYLTEEASLFRYGGDEYIFTKVFVEEVEVSAFASKVQSLFKDPFIIENQEVAISSSIGISLYPEDGEDLDTLFKKADNAMYFSKKHGRNHATFYGTHGMAKEDRLLKMEHLLQNALKREEFSLVYQPQVDLKTQKVTGIEALLRWHNEELGNVGPDHFIPIAEESGLIIEIGKWVAKEAFSQLRTWCDLGYRGLEMSINISIHQFYHEEFLTSLEKIVRESGVAPKQVVLEITESIASNADVVLGQLEKIKAMGFKVAIDDFGTGYSSLKYLKDFSIDYLKIDKSFVQEIDTNSKDQDIVSAIITLAHNLGLETIAEGTETRGQIEFLQEQGCDTAQGYFYSKPLLSKDALSFIKEAYR